MNRNANTFVPNNIVIHREQKNIFIRYRWFSWSFIPPLLVIIVLGFTAAPAYVRGAIETGAWIFPVILAPWVLFVVYYLLAKIGNYTFISINEHVVHVCHRPMPLLKNATFSIKEIKNLFISEKTNQGRSLHTAYDIVVVLTDNKKINVLKNIRNYDQVRFIANELEDVIEHALS